MSFLNFISIKYQFQNIIYQKIRLVFKRIFWYVN